MSHLIIMKIPHQKILKALSNLKKPAAELLTNKVQLLHLLELSLEKFKHLKKQYKERVHDVKNLQSMVLAWTKGEYIKIPWKSLTAACAAILYFLNPIDIIPDFLGPLGFSDDAMLLAWVVKMIKNDLNDFVAWRDGRSSSKKDDITLKAHEDYQRLD